MVAILNFNCICIVKGVMHSGFECMRYLFAGGRLVLIFFDSYSLLEPD